MMDGPSRFDNVFEAGEGALDLSPLFVDAHVLGRRQVALFGLNDGLALVALRAT